MWKNAVEHVWNTRPIEHTQKLIDRMPKVMKAIFAAKREGGKRNTVLNSECDSEITLNNGEFCRFQIIQTIDVLTKKYTTQKALFLKGKKN